MGAEWFESLLLDFDPASNYGNWTYGAGGESSVQMGSMHAAGM